ncbi:MAG: outer membrane beta-barrel protein [Hyphomicrobiales bacterium]|nr:outer membrane beta-barrel protein [Hyphomicrobiales bacterium]MBV9520404.1 outer membrane beta-barrel protein [Hyphomicrobiales bacterium]
MIKTPLLAFAMIFGFCLPAKADDATPPTPKLPTFALEQPPGSANAQSASPWTGFYAGSEVFAFSGKGVKHGAGGAAFVGYNREFDNNFVLGIEASTGYAPSLFRHGPYSGYEFAATNVKLGYDMGRLLPFVTAGFAFAKPDIRSGYLSATDTANDLFGSPSNLKVLGSVGAGFDYQVTNNLAVGVAVSAGTNRGPLLPALAP